MSDQEKVIEHLKEIAEYFRECRSNASFASKAENHFWELQNAASEAAELLKAQKPRVISLAVPLDKLCEWLSENSINIPCESCANFVNEYCTAIGDKSRPCPNSADDWRRAITEWMEEQQCTSTDTEP